MIGPPPPSFDDETFFVDFPDRKIHIRRPTSPMEFYSEFNSLGPHAYERRRVIVARVAQHVAKRFRRELMLIPFLAFADETIEDRDDILLPILDDIMANASGKPRRR